MQAEVVRLPTELVRLRESDRLVRRWLEIQCSMEGVEKVQAIFEWRSEMLDYDEVFSSDDVK